MSNLLKELPQQIIKMQKSLVEMRREATPIVKQKVKDFLVDLADEIGAGSVDFDVGFNFEDDSMIEVSGSEDD